VIGAIVLAAGGSTRMGRSKALLPLGAGTVLSAVVERVLGSGVDRLVLVLGHEADAIRAGARLPEDPRLGVVVNAGWAEGMASSLRAGLEASEDTAAVVVALGDQPGLDPASIGRLTTAWREGARIAAVAQAGRLGHPILFDRSLFPALRLLRGDAGARGILKRHADEVVRVEGAPLRDLDTPADYEALLAGKPAANDEGLDLP
jgi:CTP:molybdopterin cytidylyltransferase MocA